MLILLCGASKGVMKASLFLRDRNGKGYLSKMQQKKENAPHVTHSDVFHTNKYCNHNIGKHPNKRKVLYIKSFLKEQLCYFLRMSFLQDAVCRKVGNLVSLRLNDHRIYKIQTLSKHVNILIIGTMLPLSMENSY